MHENSENTKIGKEFQDAVWKKMEEYFNTTFERDVPVPIGKPAKNHKFDFCSEDRKIVAECKAYSWTETGNVPSAKLMGLNQVLFYMSFLPADVTKVLCIRKAIHPKKEETLAEYYARMYGHLFRNVRIFEADESGKLREIEVNIEV